MTLETRLKALEARTTAERSGFCECDSRLRKIDYRRALDVLDPDGSGVSVPEMCPICGLAYDDIPIVTYDMRVFGYDTPAPAVDANGHAVFDYDAAIRAIAPDVE